MKGAAKEPRKRMGRPPKPGAVRYTVRLTPEVHAVYVALGDGSFTRGLERGAKLLREGK